MTEKNETKTPQRFSMVMYDIPSHVKGPDYPNPAMRIRRFGAMMQYSVYCVPDTFLARLDPLVSDIRAISGADVRILPYAETAYEEVMEIAKKALSREADRIREYVENATTEVQKRLVAAAKLMSVDDTNKAVGYQATALSKAQKDLADAEECAMAFDLTGDLDTLFDGLRKLLTSRTAAWAVERTAARAILPPVPRKSRKTGAAAVIEAAKAEADKTEATASDDDAADVETSDMEINRILRNDDDDSDDGNGGGGLTGLGSL